MNKTNRTPQRVLEMVFDSPSEPDKWFQDVRLMLETLTGKDMPGKTAYQRRDDLRVQRAAPRLLEACKKALTCGLDSSVREVIVQAIADANGQGKDAPNG